MLVVDQAPFAGLRVDQRFLTKVPAEATPVTPMLVATLIACVISGDECALKLMLMTRHGLPRKSARTTSNTIEPVLNAERHDPGCRRDRCTRPIVPSGLREIGFNGFLIQDRDHQPFSETPSESRRETSEPSRIAASEPSRSVIPRPPTVSWMVPWHQRPGEHRIRVDTRVDDRDDAGVPAAGLTGVSRPSPAG